MPGLASHPQELLPSLTPGHTLGHPREKAQAGTGTGTDHFSHQRFCFENRGKVRAPLCQRPEGKYSFLTTGLQDTCDWVVDSIWGHAIVAVNINAKWHLCFHFFFSLRLKEAFYFYFCRWSLTFYSEWLIDFHRTIKMAYNTVFWDTTVKWNIIKMPVCTVLPGEDKA